jgi:hypothetical protein
VLWLFQSRKSPTETTFQPPPTRDQMITNAQGLAREMVQSTLHTLRCTSLWSLQSQARESRARQLSGPILAQSAEGEMKTADEALHHVRFSRVRMTHVEPYGKGKPDFLLSSANSGARTGRTRLVCSRSGIGRSFLNNSKTFQGNDCRLRRLGDHGTFTPGFCKRLVVDRNRFGGRG